GPQAKPRTRPCLKGLPEGEGSALTLTARGVWLVQIPLAQERKVMRWRACRQLRLIPSVKLQKVIEATKLPFAASAAQRLTSVGYAQEADFAKFGVQPTTVVGQVLRMPSALAQHSINRMVVFD
ncbi:hypothetical protein, partial [Ruegeria atlantica]|uniref:hypothetical protein n=1 Tax=Ruegeria atlantica TaxID=81569 RepID=UPI001C2B9FED